jgi:sugar phosphate isomerase/epimerase
MQHNRRKFIKISGTAAAGLALGSIAGFPLLNSCDETAKRIKKFGIQLYSLRDDMPKDPKAVLKSLASFGYKQIESYEHGQMGIFWGMGHLDFKKYMDELDMKVVASHCNINTNFEQKAEQAAAIGMRYLICPSVDSQKTVDGYKKIAAQFNRCGEICKKNGIRFAYHNHDHDFKTVDGQVAQDIFMQDTDASLVDFEMDIYWVVTAGHDPHAWLNKYPNRFKLCHVKDRVKGTTKREDSCTLGTGSIDFKSILKTAQKNGMEYYVAEQEHYAGTTPIESARGNAEFMKGLRI